MRAEPHTIAVGDRTPLGTGSTIRGNLSTLSTGDVLARWDQARILVVSSSSRATGPAVIHTTLGNRPKTLPG